MENECDSHDDPMSIDGDKSDAATETINCSICYDDLTENIIRPCKTCKIICCRACIRRMFLTACKNESAMPPRCCKTIPLAVGRCVLSAEEIDLFKEKHEEWSTANRSYCPIPTCSAFLPRRLFLTPSAKAESGFHDNGNDYSYEAMNDVMEIDIEDEPIEISYTVRCPKCTASICPKCKQLSHWGYPCPEISDITPELEALLERWNAKRCPKCRAAVRRMYGCNHMQCRCGAQWCWYCMEPIEVCGTDPCGGWEEEEDDEDDEDYEEDDEDDEEYDDKEEEGEERYENEGQHYRARETRVGSKPATVPPGGLVDLDAGTDWEQANEDFGDEPEEGTVDQYHCMHEFEEVDDPEQVDQTLEYECERCWRRIVPGLSDSTAQAQLPARNPDSLMQICYICNIMICPDCRKEIEHDNGDVEGA